jgi:hypothetical protein
MPRFLDILEGKCSLALSFHQDVGEKFPPTEEFYQGPGDDFSPV